MKSRNPESEFRSKSEARNPRLRGSRRNARQIWSAVTCHRYFAGRLFARAGETSPAAQKRRQVGALQTVLDLGLWLFPLLAASVFAQSPNQIPDLKPPLPELPPTFWDLHAPALIAGAIAALMAMALLLFWWRRPKPIVVVPPEVVAASALEALRGRPETEAVVAEASRVMRRYVVAAFGLAQDEPTAEELLAALDRDPRLTPEAVGAFADFLRECDVRQFAPAPPPAGSPLAPRALELLAQSEARRKPAPAPPQPQSRSAPAAP